MVNFIKTSYFARFLYIIAAMIPKVNRLTKKSDFDILFKEGRFIAGSLTNLKIWRIEPDKYPRRGYARTDLKIGFVVGVKIHKNAVIRNRLKRQMREVVRLLLKTGGVRAGFMAAIMAKSGMVGTDYAMIEKSVLDVLRRGSVL